MVDERKIDEIRAAKSPFRVWDLAVFAAAAVLTLTLVLTLYPKGGDTAEIVCEGKAVTLPLSTPARYEIKDKLTVVIEGGACYVTGATCKNKVCERTGKIRRVNQSITCAQHGVVVTIRGKSGVAGEVGKG